MLFLCETRLLLNIDVIAVVTIDWFPSLIKLHFRYAYNKLLKGENQSIVTSRVTDSLLHRPRI